MFAIEELTRKPEHRNHGLTIAAIVLAGLMGISAYGNGSYFGVIKVEGFGWRALLPGVLVSLACGLLGACSPVCSWCRWPDIRWTGSPRSARHGQWLLRQPAG